jgi:hypothetical protein
MAYPANEISRMASTCAETLKKEDRLERQTDLSSRHRGLMASGRYPQPAPGDT